MSATNNTPNFHLPQFIGTDRPAWLSDWNQAMTLIDSAMQQIKATADEAGSISGGQDAKITALQNTVESMQGQVSTAVDNANSAINMSKAWIQTSADNSSIFSSATQMSITYNKSYGLIYMQGLLTVSAGSPIAFADNTTLFTLPSDCRPGRLINIRNGFTLSSTGGKLGLNVVCPVQISSDGRCYVSSPHWRTEDTFNQLYVTCFASFAGAGNGWPAINQ